MQQPIKVVAVLAANPALSSLLTAVLAVTPGLRVRQFESLLALSTYMRLSPVDLVVCDFDCESAPAGRLATALRQNEALERRDFQIIGLAGEVTEEVKRQAITSGIDEVIVKPMSPKYLLERVLSRLKQGKAGFPRYVKPLRQEPPATAAILAAVFDRRVDNVVQLFPE